MHLEAEVLPTAEGPADPRHRRSDALGGDPQARGGLVAVDVEELGADEELHAEPVVVGDGEPALAPEEGLVLHDDLVLPLHHDVAHRLAVAVTDPELAEHVAVGVDRVGVNRSGGVDERGQHLVVDRDRGDRPAGDVGVIGGHRRQRLADVAHHVASEDRLVGVLEPVGRPTADVLVGDHGPDAWDGPGRPDVERHDAGVRMR